MHKIYNTLDAKSIDMCPFSESGTCSALKSEVALHNIQMRSLGFCARQWYSKCITHVTCTTKLKLISSLNQSCHSQPLRAFLIYIRCAQQEQIQ